MAHHFSFIVSGFLGWVQLPSARADVNTAHKTTMCHKVYNLFYVLIKQTRFECEGALEMLRVAGRFCVL